MGSKASLDMVAKRRIPIIDPTGMIAGHPPHSLITILSELPRPLLCIYVYVININTHQSGKMLASYWSPTREVPVTHWHSLNENIP